MCVSSNPPISVSEKIAQIKKWSNQYMEEIALLKNEKSRFLLRCSVLMPFPKVHFRTAIIPQAVFQVFSKNFLNHHIPIY